MEKISFDFELKDIGAAGEFEGWASTHALDYGGDKVLPGAFSATLRKSKGVVPVLFNHDRSKIVGVGMEAQEDHRGLYVRAKIAMGTQLGRETHELMSMGALKGLSIGYTIPPKGAVNDGKVRMLKTIDLLEYSAVAFGMNPEAQVARVKCLSEMTPRDLEDQLRDVFGLSQREAKIAMSQGFKSLLGQRDVDSQDDDDSEDRNESVRQWIKEMQADMNMRHMLSEMHTSLSL